jgi:hypothetical protein
MLGSTWKKYWSFISKLQPMHTFESFDVLALGSILVWMLFELPVDD